MMAPPAGAPPGLSHGRLSFRFVVGVDVAGFSPLCAADQAEVQRDLARALDEAATGAGLERTQWVRQVAGDGELAFLPSDTDVLRLVGAFPRELERALADVNAQRTPRLRVRFALHHGTLMDGPFGPVGSAPIVAARLLDAQVLRDELARGGADLALIVSRRIYDDIVQTGLEGLDPAVFEPVDVRAKGRAFPAYIRRNPPGGRAVQVAEPASRRSLKRLRAAVLL
ncbi:hypothetical protein [Actinomadura parmotrematis]|uniref:Adenylate/guanylate cyclase domain-containing protein n=1 Tax=Actinomadura parmotrematis TaxID=2864039 RepID=A0ABS7FYZ6_9ACTN|nr:hypothetical protein [Actinomadura parmotrematis]MBW8485662.1 hypothetical protein [Actinomadura parmotrematis]